MHLTYLTTYLPSKLCFSNTLKDDERGGECEECKSVCESYSEEERECDRKRDSELMFGNNKVSYRVSRKIEF